MAAVGPGLAGDDVHHRGLARAVGADDASQLAGRDVQAQAVDGLETVEADVHVFQVQDAAVRGVHFPGRVDAAVSRGAATRFGPAQHARGLQFLVALRAFFHQVGRHALAPRIFFTRPTTPCGIHSVTAMNSAPRKERQNSGKVTVSQLLAPLTMKAPMMGPTSVARPPTAAQTAISMLAAVLISPGLMMPTCGTYSAPAMPHITAEIVQMVSL